MGVLIADRDLHHWCLWQMARTYALKRAENPTHSVLLSDL
jgi:hypothetical protein